MVQLTRYSLKNLIMESLFKLKQSEQKFRQIVIADDMTKTERDECKKKLVAEATAMATDDTSGEYIIPETGSTGGCKDSQAPKAKLRNKNELDNLEILYTNADGLINKRYELKVLINSLPQKPDIIAVTEIKPTTS